jgi:hypothetical protein
MFSWVLTKISEFCSWFVEWLWLLGRSGSWPESDPLVPVLIVMSIFLGSACLAATVAELRNRKLLPHFCLGFLVPVAYPIYVMFGLKKKTVVSAEDNEEIVMEEAAAAMNMQMDVMLLKRELKARGIDPDTATFEDFEALRQEKRATEEAAVQAKSETQASAVAEAEAGGVVINKVFFESIAVDAAGNRLGPYLIVMTDGSELVANYITGVFDELVSCEVSGRDGKARTVRVRYENIADVRQA